MGGEISDSNSYGNIDQQMAKDVADTQRPGANPNHTPRQLHSPRKPVHRVPVGGGVEKPSRTPSPSRFEFEAANPGTPKQSMRDADGKLRPVSSVGIPGAGDHPKHNPYAVGIRPLPRHAAHSSDPSLPIAKKAPSPLLSQAGHHANSGYASAMGAGTTPGLQSYMGSQAALRSQESVHSIPSGYPTSVAPLQTIKQAAVPHQTQAAPQQNARQGSPSVVVPGGLPYPDGSGSGITQNSRGVGSGTPSPYGQYPYISLDDSSGHRQTGSVHSSSSGLSGSQPIHMAIQGATIGSGIQTQPAASPQIQQQLSTQPLAPSTSLHSRNSVSSRTSGNSGLVNAELGVGTGSAYVKELRRRSATAWSEVSSKVWGLPIGTSPKGSRAISSSSLQTNNAYLRRAMDIKHSHLTPRLLASEVDEDDEDNLGSAFGKPSSISDATHHTKTPSQVSASAGGGPGEDASLKSSPLFVSGTPTISRTSSNSSTKSVDEGVGKIRLFVANPDSD